MHLRLTSTGLFLEGGIEKSDTETTVLLSHNPDSKTEVQDHPWDLMLCGHAHGGQLWIPFFGAPFASIRDRRFVKGLRRWNNRWIHVTKGVGNLHGLRLNWRNAFAASRSSAALSCTSAKPRLRFRPLRPLPRSSIRLPFDWLSEAGLPPSRQ